MTAIPAPRPRRVLYLLPSILDDAPEALKNGLAIRNACATEGRCPSCGAVGELEPDARPGVFHRVFRHERDCGVLSDPEAA